MNVSRPTESCGFDFAFGEEYDLCKRGLSSNSFLELIIMIVREIMTT